MFDPREKLAVFIDGPNIYATARALDFEIDYKKLMQHLGNNGYLLRSYYYTTVPDDDEYTSIRPLLDYLNYNGYRIVTKAVRAYAEHEGRKKYRGNMNVEIAVDMLEMCGKADHMVLFSGDGDYVRLVEAVQRHGPKVSVVSTLDMVADSLRKGADHFIDLEDLRSAVGRD